MLCWVFGEPPSRLRSTILWQYSKQDIDMLVRVKLGHEQAVLLQEYENLLLTAHAVFGGKKRKAIEPGSFEEAASMLKAFGGHTDGGRS